MFHMKFQSAVEYSSGEVGNERTVRQSTGDAVSSEPVPKREVFEGNVGKFLKVRPLPSTNITFPQGFTDGHSSLRSRHSSPAVQVAQVAPEEIVNLEESTQGSADSLPQQVKNVHVLGGTTSLRVNHRMVHKSSAIVVANLYCQASTRPQDSKMVSVEAPYALVAARKTNDSSCSTELSECSTPSHRNEGDKAMTEIMQERENFVHRADKFTKPLSEPLLAAHDQEELDLMAKEEAKLEAKRLVEEQRLERQRQIRELRDLALCNLGPSPSLGESPAFKKSKLKKILGKTGMTAVYRFLRNPYGIFRSNNEYPDAREAEVVITRGSLFAPSSGTTLDSQLAVMRNAPHLRASTQPTLQFTTVESTQRDVPAWTREEYLRKNGRIQMNSTTNQKEDKEFGGIEGNNLMNQYFDDDVDNDVDDDDSDSD